MDFGVLQIFQNYEGDTPDSQLWTEEVAMGVLAEELGYDSLWCVEHHFRDYAACPDNMQYLSYMAARTERITLATGAVILPWNNPLRVAEKMSMLDHLSGGRALFGMGRGLARREYEGVGIDMTTSRARFDEAADMILDALDSGFVEGKGPYYPQVRTEIRPRPRAGFRDRAYAIAMSPDSADSAARIGTGMAVFSQQPWEMTAESMGRYRELFEKAHGRPAPPPITADMVVCHEDEERARELAMKHVVGYLVTVLDHYELKSDHFKKAKGYEMYAASVDFLREAGLDGIRDTYLEVNAWGTPQQIIDKLERRREIIGDFHLNACFRMAGIPYEDAVHSQRLFAEKVMPAFR